MDEVHGDSLWRHVQAVYDKMWEQRDDASAVWEGFTTHLQQELGIPVPYYGAIMDALKRMGCVDQLQRGGGSSPSRWALYRPPALQEYVDVRAQLKARPRASRDDALTQRVTDIEERLQGLDVAKALAELQLQIDLLKGESSAVA